MKEKIKNKLHAGKTKLKDTFGEVYSPDDMALMEEGMGTVEIILIIVEKPNAKHRYVLCGN